MWIELKTRDNYKDEQCEQELSYYNMQYVMTAISRILKKQTGF